jgi:hypothetical protein
MHDTLSDTTVLTAISNHASCAVGNESVILHLNSGIYYGLDEVGTWIWTQLQQPRTVAEIRTAVADSYEMGGCDFEPELMGFLHSLVEHHLVAATEPANPGATPG